MGKLSNRRKIVYFLVLLVQIVIIYCFCSGMEEKIAGTEADFFQQSFGTGDLKYNFGLKEDERFTVDSTMTEEAGEQGAVFTYGPYISLKPGDYQVTVHYAADTDRNQIRVYSNENAGLSGDTAYTLPADKTEFSFPVYLNRKTSDFEVQTVYFGEGTLQVSSLDIESMGVIGEDSPYAALIKCVFLLVFFVLLDVLLLYLSQKKSHIFYLAVLLFFTFVLSAPLYTKQLISGHDIMFHLGRIYGIRDELLNGNFYVKLQPNWIRDYGYLVGVFYGDVFLYIPAILSILGLSVMDAYKAFMVLMTLGTAVVTYFCIHDISKDKKIGLLGSILYTAGTYRLLDLYLRHSVGETLAMLFFPLILCGMNRIYRKENNRYGWVFLSTGLFGLIHSHILSCEMAGIFLLIFFIINIKDTLRKGVLKQLLLSFGVTVLASLSFLVPFLECYVTGNFNVMNAARNSFSLEDRGITVTQLLELFVPAAGSNQDIAQGIAGEMPLTIGFALVCGIFIAIVSLFAAKQDQTAETEAVEEKEAEEVQKRKPDNGFGRKKVLLMYIAFAVLGIFMSTIYFPWDSIRKLPFLENAVSSIQFPWRFLALAAVFAVFALCEGFMLLKQTPYKKYLNQLGGALILLSLLSAMYFIAGTNNRDDYIEFYSAKELNLFNTGEEYLPVGTDIEQLDGEYRIEGDMVFSNYTKRGTVITADIAAGEDTVLEVPLIYYKYYKAVINDAELEVYGGENNTVTVKIPKGTSGSLQIKYVMPVHWILSFAVSVITAASVLLYLIYDILLKNRKKTAGNNS